MAVSDFMYLGFSMFPRIVISTGRNMLRKRSCVMLKVMTKAKVMKMSMTICHHRKNMMARGFGKMRLNILLKYS